MSAVLQPHKPKNPGDFKPNGAPFREIAGYFHSVKDNPKFNELWQRAFKELSPQDQNAFLLEELRRRVLLTSQDENAQMKEITRLAQAQLDTEGGREKATNFVVHLLTYTAPDGKTYYPKEVIPRLLDILSRS